MLGLLGHLDESGEQKVKQILDIFLKEADQNSGKEHGLWSRVDLGLSPSPSLPAE